MSTFNWEMNLRVAEQKQQILHTRRKKVESILQQEGGAAAK